MSSQINYFSPNAYFLAQTPFPTSSFRPSTSFQPPLRLFKPKFKRQFFQIRCPKFQVFSKIFCFFFAQMLFFGRIWAKLGRAVKISKFREKSEKPTKSTNLRALSTPAWAHTTPHSSSSTRTKWTNRGSLMETKGSAQWWVNFNF